MDSAHKRIGEVHHWPPNRPPQTIFLLRRDVCGRINECGILSADRGDGCQIFAAVSMTSYPPDTTVEEMKSKGSLRFGNPLLPETAVDARIEIFGTNPARVCLWREPRRVENARIACRNDLTAGSRAASIR